MLETEFLFFQGMKKRIDQRISEGNYDEAAVSMQKCMEYILNSLDGRNNDYQKVCVLFEVQARVMENHPQYPFYWHEWETVIKYCDQQMHLQGKPIDLEQLKSDTVIAHQMFEKIVQDYLNHGDSVISNKLNNEHRPENQRPQQKTKWQSPETKIIHPAEPSMQERFNRAWNQIYQRIRRGDSIVIIDPERRLHTREMWIYLTIHGYCVDSYDLDCMDGSCCFNCLSGFDKKLRKEDLDLIQRIANDIINDQRHNVPFAVDKISKILLSAVMIAAITEMEEKDRNMVEIATIFRLGVSGIMLDKILHVMFDEIDISHPGKKLFEIYSEAPVGIKLYAIQRVADALKVYEDYISENFKLHQYDMAMPIKQKCVLFVTPGKTAQDKVLFSSFMEKLYDMMIAAADLNPKHPKVQVDLFDYPLHGVIEGLDDYMKYGNDKGIYTTLYTECKDIETIDQEECMEHINEIYDHCKIDILIEDTDSSLHYTHKCGNTTIGEEPEIPGMSCHSNDPKYREIIKCKDNEDAIECHCYMYRSENHPYPIPENTEDLLTMYSKRR